MCRLKCVRHEVTATVDTRVFIWYGHMDKWNGEVLVKRVLNAEAEGEWIQT